MYSVIKTKNFSAPELSEKEILRYAGCASSDESIDSLLRSCLAELEYKLLYKVCYRKLPLHIGGSVCDFELFSVNSRNLALNLSGCNHVIIFAATLGFELDRFISKYSRLSPSRALMFQAIGAERIEAVCDCFCDEIKKEFVCSLKPRFSPGYGDLSLETQKQLFSILDCERQLGISLNSSLLMSPSKSVTAFVGLYDESI